MALCPNHHDQATAGALTEAEQRTAKGQPFNCGRGYADGQLVIHQAGQDVVLGGHVFSARTGDLLRVGDDALLRTSLSPRGTLLLGVRLFDEGDNLLAEIVENEWISHDPLPWDITFDYQHLAVRNAPRKISLDVDCRVQPAVIRGNFWRKGRLLRADAKGLHVGEGHLVGAGRIEGAVIELDAEGEGFSLVAAIRPRPAPTYRGERTQRKKKAQDLR